MSEAEAICNELKLFMSHGVSMSLEDQAALLETLVTRAIKERHLDAETPFEVIIHSRAEGPLFVRVEPNPDTNPDPIEHYEMLAMEYTSRANNMLNQARVFRSTKKLEEKQREAAIGHCEVLLDKIITNDIEGFRRLMSALRHDRTARDHVRGKIDQLGDLFRRTFASEFAEEISEIDDLLDRAEHVDPLKVDPIRMEAAQVKITDLQARFGPTAVHPQCSRFNDIQQARRKASRVAKMPPSADLDSINPFADPVYDGEFFF